jgi:hypothetical protein
MCANPKTGVVGRGGYRLPGIVTFTPPPAASKTMLLFVELRRRPLLALPQQFSLRLQTQRLQTIELLVCRHELNRNTSMRQRSAKPDQAEHALCAD